MLTMNNSDPMNTAITPNQWLSAWSKIARSRFWLYSFIAIGSASSLIYPHAPLVGLAVVAGSSMTRRLALLAAFSIWIANQFFGYTIRQYPLTLESVTWGLVMGVGTILVTLIASFGTKFSRNNFQNNFLWLCASLIVGFITFEGLILIVDRLQEEHILTSSILFSLFIKDAIWAIALTLIHNLLIWRIRVNERRIA
jgi:hypothetical protein